MGKISLYHKWEFNCVFSPWNADYTDKRRATQKDIFLTVAGEAPLKSAFIRVCLRHLRSIECTTQPR